MPYNIEPDQMSQNIASDQGASDYWCWRIPAGYYHGDALWFALCCDFPLLSNTG